MKQAPVAGGDRRHTMLHEDVKRFYRGFPKDAHPMANLFACISAGISALWGPLHGGANQKVVEMLEQIAQGGDSVEDFVDRSELPATPRLRGARLARNSQTVSWRGGENAVMTRRATEAPADVLYNEGAICPTNSPFAPVPAEELAEVSGKKENGTALPRSRRTYITVRV